MSTCAWLATALDLQMLEKRMYPPDTPIEGIPSRQGSDVADEELSGRWLLRYVLPGQQMEPQGDRIGERTFVTPTPYAPSDLSDWLDLPFAEDSRDYVIRLDPSQIEFIAGPMFVGAAMGVQYVLPQGYGPEAVMGPGWAQRVR